MQQHSSVVSLVFRSLMALAIALMLIGSHLPLSVSLLAASRVSGRTAGSTLSRTGMSRPS